MENFELTILGCGSAMPTTRHYPSSQILNHRERFFMIDCGEGAQLQYRRNKIKFYRRSDHRDNKRSGSESRL